MSQVLVRCFAIGDINTVLVRCGDTRVKKVGFLWLEFAASHQLRAVTLLLDLFLGWHFAVDPNQQ